VKPLEIVGSKVYLGFEYHFEHNGRRYRWQEKFRKFKCNSHEIVGDMLTKEVIARFKIGSPLEVWRKKTCGMLVNYDEVWKVDNKLMYVLVMTSSAVRQSIREKKRMGKFWKFSSGGYRWRDNLSSQASLLPDRQIK